MDIVIALAAGYAIGGVPFAYWLARLRGVSLTSVGTGNPGAANMFRRVSRPLGVLAALLDFGKGALAVWVGHWLGMSDGLSLVGGFAAVAGHWHSPFLRFRGGEGLATGTGVALGAAPIAGAIGLAVAVVLIARLHNTSLGAGYGGAALAAASVGLGDPPEVTWSIVGLGLVVLARYRLRSLWHRGRPEANASREIKGTG